ncbi:alpha-tocopherol transfer protein-like [Thrips palmi]|uniref:Alpha-tocopherol transfer protein-like n=1 Tax=Thrips palmi TaxID=161013 RepID=A0A6P8Y4I5_THRPL|nr:alpha-tocopherol transfer protein-like [Thrips palmi]
MVVTTAEAAVAAVPRKQEEMEDNAEAVLEGLQGLRELVQADADLVCPVTDEFLSRFLWAADLDVKKSYHLVQEYFAARRDYPDVFLLNDPNMYVSIFESNELGFELADRDALGRRIFVARIGDMDPTRHKFEEVLQTCLMTLESLSVDPEVQRLGIVVLVDITRFSYKLVRWLTPYKIKVSLKFLQDCIPIKMQAFYCVNAPRVFSLTYNAVKPLMKEEFRRKISWHNGDLSSLHKVIPPCVLTKDFGGTGEVNWADWFNHVLEKKPMFEELKSYGYVKQRK